MIASDVGKLLPVNTVDAMTETPSVPIVEELMPNLNACMKYPVICTN